MDISKSRIIFKIFFFIFFVTLAILHIRGLLKFDSISISLIVIAVIPILLPSIAKNFKSFEIFGIKAELLEKIEKQEEKIENQKSDIKNQQEIINKLVIFSRAFYFDAMLRDFKKCEAGEMKEYNFRKNKQFEHRLEYLMDNGFLETNFKIESLIDGENIAGNVKLTPIGSYYIEIRKKFELL